MCQALSFAQQEKLSHENAKGVGASQKLLYRFVYECQAQLPSLVGSFSRVNAKGVGVFVVLTR
jgi:hypothetical protein